MCILHIHTGPLSLHHLLSYSDLQIVSIISPSRHFSSFNDQRLDWSDHLTCICVSTISWQEEIHIALHLHGHNLRCKIQRRFTLHYTWMDTTNYALDMYLAQGGPLGPKARAHCTLRQNCVAKFRRKDDFSKLYVPCLTPCPIRRHGVSSDTVRCSRVGHGVRHF